MVMVAVTITVVQVVETFIRAKGALPVVSFHTRSSLSLWCGPSGAGGALPIRPPNVSPCAGLLGGCYR